MIEYRNPSLSEMGTVLDLRWSVLRDPSKQQDGTHIDAYDRDPTTIHGAIFIGGLILATARMHTPVEVLEARQIRFMAVRPECVRLGLGQALLGCMEDQAMDTEPKPEIFVANARITALRFWKAIGYTTVGDVYVDETTKLRHVKIKKEV